MTTPSDDTGAAGMTGGTFAAVMGAMGWAGALYGYMAATRPKRLFLEKPPAEERARLFGEDEEHEGARTADTLVTPAEREMGRMLLAQILEDWRWAGMDDYLHHREKLMKIGVYGPANIKVPDDELQKVLWSSWKTGWEQARMGEALGLPPPSRSEARGDEYIAAFHAMAAKARETDRLREELQLLASKTVQLFELPDGSSEEAHMYLVRQVLPRAKAALREAQILREVQEMAEREKAVLAAKAAASAQAATAETKEGCGGVCPGKCPGTCAAKTAETPETPEGE